MKKLLLSITTSFLPVVAVTSVVSCSPSINQLFFRNKDVMEDVTELIGKIPNDPTSNLTLENFKIEIENILNDYIFEKNIDEIRDFYVLDLYWVYGESDWWKEPITQETFSLATIGQANYVVKVEFEERDGLEWDSETEEFSIYNSPISYLDYKEWFDKSLSEMVSRYEFDKNDTLFELEQDIVEELSDKLSYKFKNENIVEPHQSLSGELIADYHINVDIEGITNIGSIDTSKRYRITFTSGTGVDFGGNTFVKENVRFRKDN